MTMVSSERFAPESRDVLARLRGQPDGASSVNRYPEEDGPSDEDAWQLTGRE